jgi:hypothetical protein
MFQKIFQQFLRRFFLTMGREPLNPAEWMQIQDDAVRYLNKTKGAPNIKKDPFQGFTPKIVPKVEEKITIDDLLKGPVRSSGPKGDRIWDFSQKRGEVIPFPKKPKRGIEELIENEDIFVGKAPKTKKSRLDWYKEAANKKRYSDDFYKGPNITKEEWVAKKKQENKDAIRRFQEKTKKDEPDKFYAGGIAPLVGEPSYSADFYDDRIPMAGGGALFKFIEKLFIKASNDIRLGRGKWKGLDQKQIAVQHDNLTKKVIEFQKTGKLPEGTEQYFDVNPNEAFAAAQAKVKKTVPEVSGIDDLLKSDFNKAAGVVDERTALKQKYPGISDDLVEKILVDDNPQRKADVIGTIDDYMKLREIGKGEEEAYDIITRSFSKTPTKHAEGGRVSYSGGGRAGLPAVTMGTPQMNMQRPQMPAMGPQPAGIPGANLQMNQMDLMQQKMQQNPWMQNQMKQGIGGMQNPQYKGQFRMPFGAGGMGRRAFMKMMAGLAALPFMPKAITKLAPKAVPKVVETVASSNASGMPIWFPKLVERVIKEGDDVTKTAGTVERQTVHRATTPAGTPIEVMQDLTSGNVVVDIGEQTKHGWSSGRHGQPTRLVLNKGEWIEPTKGKPGVKTKDEFFVEEAEFTGGHPENVKFEEIAESRYGDHGSDFTEIEKFAVGKNTDKKIIGKKAESDAWAEGRAEAQAEEFDDYASGGIARMLGE